MISLADEVIGNLIREKRKPPLKAALVYLETLKL
jgi:hypothetical protein